METFIDRLKTARTELDGRVSRLIDFLSTDKTKELPPAQMACLLMQAEVMRLYLAILDRRIELLAGDSAEDEGAL